MRRSTTTDCTVCVGAEVAIGSFLVNFMGRPEIAGLSAETAGKHLSFYWGGAMVGRFIIMFPTIFTLAIEGLGRYTGAGSGVLCMAIVGGAIVPLLQGFYADHLSVLSFVIPLLCYLYVAYYGLRGHRANFSSGGG